MHCFEQDRCLSEIAIHNFTVLGKNNITCSAADGMQQITKTNYDIIYVDPSRRHESKGKVFFLNDCQPNVLEKLDVLLSNCNQLVVKTSPMLDLTIGLNELKHVFAIHIVAINNEVKELLWFLKKDFTGVPEVKTINFKKRKTETFNFLYNQLLASSYAPPKMFLYEPNAAIMKSGAFRLLSERYNLAKLHLHTHLYTNDTLINFPGRRFTINEVIPYRKKELKNFLKITKANITTRNFPENVATLRKRLKIKDGGAVFLFFVTSENNEKLVLVCSKV